MFNVYGYKDCWGLGWSGKTFLKILLWGHNWKIRGSELNGSGVGRVPGEVSDGEKDGSRCWWQDERDFLKALSIVSGAGWGMGEVSPQSLPNQWGRSVVYNESEARPGSRECFVNENAPCRCESSWEFLLAAYFKKSMTRLPNYFWRLSVEWNLFTAWNWGLQRSFCFSIDKAGDQVSLTPDKKMCFRAFKTQL